MVTNHTKNVQRRPSTPPPTRETPKQQNTPRTNSQTTNPVPKPSFCFQSTYVRYHQWTCDNQPVHNKENFQEVSEKTANTDVDHVHKKNTPPPEIKPPNITENWVLRKRNNNNMKTSHNTLQKHPQSQKKTPHTPCAHAQSQSQSQVNTQSQNKMSQIWNYRTEKSSDCETAVCTVIDCQKLVCMFGENPHCTTKENQNTEEWRWPKYF